MNESCLNETELLTHGTLGAYTELHVAPHVHRQIELFYVAKGSISISIDDRRFKLNRGEYTVIAPFVLHSFESEDSDNLYYSPILPDEYSEQLSLRTDAPVLCDSDGDIAKILNTCVTLSELNDPSLRTCLYTLVSEVLKSRFALSPTNDIDGIIIKYIQTNFAKPLTLRSIAEACRTNRTYVSRAVHGYAKMHLNQFLNRLRLNALIEQYNLCPDRSIETMSLSVGFDCPRTFYRAFRSLFGMNPRTYFSRIPR